MRSSHDYPMTSSAPDGRCRYAHNQSAQNLSKPLYRIYILGILEAFPEALGRVSHDNGKHSRIYTPMTIVRKTNSHVRFKKTQN
jgi:hypothetical protein